MEKMFEIATRTKMRFPYKGMITVEDLWDVSRAGLDTIYKALCAQRKVEAGEESLIVSATKSKETEELDVKIEIVKYIFNVKTEEAAARATEKDRKDKKQKLMAILAEKENEEIRNMSKDELTKMIEELG